MVEDGSSRSPAAALVFQVAQSMGKASAVHVFLAKLEENWVESLDDLRGIGRDHLIQDLQFPSLLAKRVMDSLDEVKGETEILSKETTTAQISSLSSSKKQNLSEKKVAKAAANSKKSSSSSTGVGSGKTGTSPKNAKRAAAEEVFIKEPPKRQKTTEVFVKEPETDAYAQEFLALDEKFKKKKNKEKSPMLAPVDEIHTLGENFSLRTRRRTRNGEQEEKLQKRREFLDTYSLWLSKEREKLGKTALRFSSLYEIAFIKKPVLAGPNASDVAPNTVVEEGAVLRVGQVREMSIQQVFESSAFVACQNLFQSHQVILPYLRESVAGELRYMDLSFPEEMEVSHFSNFQSGGSTSSSFQHFLQDPWELQNRQLQACVLMHARLSEKQLLLWYTGALGLEKQLEQSGTQAKDEWAVISKEVIVIKGVELAAQVQVNLNPSTVSLVSGSNTPVVEAKEDVGVDEKPPKSSMKVATAAASSKGAKSPVVKKTASKSNSKAAPVKKENKAVSSSSKAPNPLPKIEVLEEEAFDTDQNGEGSKSSSHSSSTSSSTSGGKKSSMAKKIPKILKNGKPAKIPKARKPKPKTAKPGRKEYKRKQYNFPEVENSDLRPRSRLWIHLMPRMPDGWQTGLYEYLRPSRTAIRWFRYEGGPKMLTIEQFVEALKENKQYDDVVEVVKQLHEKFFKDHPFEVSQNLDENGEILPVYKAPPAESPEGSEALKEEKSLVLQENVTDLNLGDNSSSSTKPTTASPEKAELPPTWLPALPNPKDEEPKDDATPVKRGRGRPRKYVTLVPTITNILGSSESPVLSSADAPEGSARSGDESSEKNRSEKNEKSEKVDVADEKVDVEVDVADEKDESLEKKMGNKIPVFEESSGESAAESEHRNMKAIENERCVNELSTEVPASLPQKIRKGSRSRESDQKVESGEEIETLISV